MSPGREAQYLGTLRLLRRGSCWCEMAVGNPMVRTHSEGCRQAQRLLEQADGPPVGYGACWRKLPGGRCRFPRGHEGDCCPVPWVGDQP